MRVVNKVLLWTIGILLGIVFAMLIGQVFFRYVSKTSVSWTEEAARYAIVWTVFLGVAVAMKEKSLIAVEVVVQFIPDKVEKVFRIIVLFLSMIFMVYLVYLGTNLSINAADQNATALGISMWIPYAAIPIGSFFTLLNIFVVMIESLTGKKEEMEL